MGYFKADALIRDSVVTVGSKALDFASPDEPSNRVTLGDSSHVGTNSFNRPGKVTTKNGSITKSIGVKSLDIRRILCNCRYPAFCTSAGDPRSGTSTTKAFVVVWLILVVAEEINNMEDNAKVNMENNHSRYDG